MPGLTQMKEGGKESWVDMSAMQSKESSISAKISCQRSLEPPRNRCALVCPLHSAIGWEKPVRSMALAQNGQWLSEHTNWPVRLISL